MILQHCPIKYRNKPYGCGFGPIAPTPAFLDYWGKCPKCGKAFKPFRKSITSMIMNAHKEKAYSCQVTDINGNQYCDGKVNKGQYCDRHQHVEFSPENQLNLFGKGE